MWSAKNPFLLGPFEPLQNEYDIQELRVEGEIPRELNGTLYRTGSNQHYHPLEADHFHWFDGDGMVHAFQLHEGRASYRNRWVETDGLKSERAAGRALYNGIFGSGGIQQPPLPEGAPEIKTVAGINVIKLADRVLTLHEVESYYWELEPKTLETLGKFDFNGKTNGMLTGHPHEDPQTGEMLFYALDNERKILECFAVSKKDAEITSLHRTPMPFAPWVHDFIFSTDYYIFLFSPVQARPLEPGRIASGKSSWSFDYDAGGKILLMHRRTGKVKWIEIPPTILADHYLNAYQDGKKIIIDASVCTISVNGKFNVEDYFPFPVIEGPSPFSQPYLYRFTIDLTTNKVQYSQIGDFSAEFVRPNENLLGVRHRYGYMAGLHSPQLKEISFNCLVKHDYVTGKSTFQKLSKLYDMVPGEPVFVPRSNAKDEDDGWILAVWYDPRRNASEMVIQEAKDFDGEPVARIKLDHRVPPGFHGNWIPED